MPRTSGESHSSVPGPSPLPWLPQRARESLGSSHREQYGARRGQNPQFPLWPSPWPLWVTEKMNSCPGGLSWALSAVMHVRHLALSTQERGAVSVSLCVWWQCWGQLAVFPCSLNKKPSWDRVHIYLESFGLQRTPVHRRQPLFWRWGESEADRWGLVQDPTGLSLPGLAYPACTLRNPLHMEPRTSSEAVTPRAAPELGWVQKSLSPPLWALQLLANEWMNESATLSPPKRRTNK